MRGAAMNLMLAGLVLTGLALAGLALGGCATRTLEVTSEPSGARVVINDVEVGRTPVEASFTYYGDYDVLLTLDGYEPLRTKARARAPIYEYPPLDLGAEAVGARTRVQWHFVLTPSLERTLTREALEAGMLERADRLRERAAE